jgi:hypothetical protein
MRHQRRRRIYDLLMRVKFREFQMRDLLTIITAGIFLLASTAPAMAAPDLFPGTRDHTHGQYSRTSAITAGAYVRVPFNGGLRRPAQEPRFGLRLSGNLAGQYRHQNTFLGGGSQRLLDLSLGASGSDSFRLNGLTINQINALYAGEEEDGNGGKKKSGFRRGLVYGLAAVGVIVLVGVVVEVADGDK